VTPDFRNATPTTLEAAQLYRNNLMTKFLVISLFEAY